MNKSMTLLTGTLLITTLFAHAEDQKKPKAVTTPAITAAPKPVVAKEALATIDGAEMGKWTMDLVAAKKLAAEKKVPILLDFSGSDWCGWCKLMEKNVFTQPAWKAYAKENLVMVLLDFPKDKSLVPEKYVARNDELRNKYSIQGFPTFIVLDDDGQTELGRISAGQSKTPESVIGELKALFKNRAVEIAKYIAKLSPEAQGKFKAIQAKIEKAKAQETTLKKTISDTEKQLSNVIKDQISFEEELQMLRVTQLGTEELAKYKKLKADLKSKVDELEAWIKTGPQQNQENQVKFMAMQRGIQAIQQELDKY